MNADQRITELRLRVKRLARHHERSAKQEAAYHRLLRELVELEHGSVDGFFKATFKD